MYIYVYNTDWQLFGATDCYGHKDMHNSCQSTGNQGLAAAAGAKGKAGACGTLPAAAGLSGHSQVHSDFPQLASGPLCYTPSVAGGRARDLSKAWCAPWHSSMCPLKDLAAPSESVTSVPVAPGLPCRFSWTVTALKSLHNFISLVSCDTFKL